MSARKSSRQKKQSRQARKSNAVNAGEGFQSMRNSPQVEQGNVPDTKGDTWLSLSEVAEKLGVCPRTLRNWEKRGIFQLRRLGLGGRLVGLTQNDLDKWMKSSITFGVETD